MAPYINLETPCWSDHKLVRSGRNRGHCGHSLEFSGRTSRLPPWTGFRVRLCEGRNSQHANHLQFKNKTHVLEPISRRHSPWEPAWTAWGRNSQHANHLSMHNNTYSLVPISRRHSPREPAWIACYNEQADLFYSTGPQTRPEVTQLKRKKRTWKTKWRLMDREGRN